MRKLPVIVFALFFAIGAECGDDDPPDLPKCADFDECGGDLFCTQDGVCDCPAIGGTCHR